MSTARQMKLQDASDISRQSDGPSGALSCQSTGEKGGDVSYQVGIAGGGNPGAV